jgi:hypothetical protein
MSARVTVMTIVGSLLIITSSVALSRRKRRFSGWRKAMGSIVAIESDHVAGQATGADSTHHSTTVRFEDHRGNEVVVGDLSYTHQDHVGRRVPILYDTTSTAATIDDWRKHVVEWSGIMAGSVCMLIATLMD